MYSLYNFQLVEIFENMRREEGTLICLSSSPFYVILHSASLKTSVHKSNCFKTGLSFSVYSYLSLEFYDQVEFIEDKQCNDNTFAFLVLVLIPTKYLFFEFGSCF